MAKKVRSRKGAGLLSCLSEERAAMIRSIRRSPGARKRAGNGAGAGRFPPPDRGKGVRRRPCQGKRSGKAGAYGLRKTLEKAQGSAAFFRLLLPLAASGAPHRRMAALAPAAIREKAGQGGRIRRAGKRKGDAPFGKRRPCMFYEDGEAQAFFSGRKEARMPRARKPTTTLREIMAGRWITPATSSSILTPMKARMAMTDFSRWRR